MRSSLLRKLGVSLASLVVLFCLAEIAARLAEPGPFTFLDRGPYMAHPEARQVHRPNFKGRWDGTYYETNSLGLRGPELPAAAQDDFWVVALGDSCTFGKGVLQTQTWPRQLEVLLGETLLPDTTPAVANFGVNGYSGNDYRILFEELGMAMEPDLVVLGFNLNDFPNVVMKVDHTVFQGQHSLRARIPGGLRDALGRLSLYRWLRATYYELNETRDYERSESLAAEIAEADPVQTERLDGARKELLRIVDDARSVGAQCAIFLFPYESQVYQETFDDSAIAWLRGVCLEKDILFIDVLTPFRHEARQPRAPDLFLRGDRYHPSPEGYAIVAREVFEAVRGMDWLPDAKQ